MSKIGVKGHYKFQLKRDGKIIDEWEADNVVTNQGIDHILATEFAQGPQVTTWYVGIFKNNYVPVVADKASTFSQNAGECTSAGQQRQPFVAVEANQVAGNSASPASFTFTASDTVTGAFLSSAQAVGSAQGTLFSALTFATPRQVVANDQLSVVFTVQGQNA